MDTSTERACPSPNLLREVAQEVPSHRGSCCALPEHIPVPREGFLREPSERAGGLVYCTANTRMLTQAAVATTRCICCICCICRICRIVLPAYLALAGSLKSPPAGITGRSVAGSADSPDFCCQRCDARPYTGLGGKICCVPPLRRVPGRRATSIARQEMPSFVERGNLSRCTFWPFSALQPQIRGTTYMISGTTSQPRLRLSIRPQELQTNEKVPDTAFHDLTTSFQASAHHRTPI